LLYPSRNGDLVIQTNDKILFGVHTVLLRLSSSMTADMLSVGSESGERSIVSVTEDSTVFQDLLSFIYPDKCHTIFTALTSLMPVLDAAAKYDMKGVVRALISQLTTGGALMYQDPLWVYSKAKQLDLADLAKWAAKATLAIDLGGNAYRPEVANGSASWILELVSLRTEHSQWWRNNCLQEIPIARMNKHYELNTRSGTAFRHTSCQCPQLSTADTIKPPIQVVLKILEHPCARSVRKIDFHQVIGCLRCGAAATAHYRKICLEYEKHFGEF